MRPLTSAQKAAGDAIALMDRLGKSRRYSRYPERWFDAHHRQQTATFSETRRPVGTPTDLARPRSGPSVPPLPTRTDTEGYRRARWPTVCRR